MSQTRSPRPDWPVLVALSLATGGLYGLLVLLGPRYALDVPVADRPLLLVIGVYFAAFVAYWFAWALATRGEPGRRLLWWLLGTSLLWRAALLPTPPFQEIDIYRYLWDGAVTRHGGDPYRYPPATVVEAIDITRAGAQPAEGRLAELVALATHRAPEYETVLRTIHFGELPSPYPPVSQAVFAAASLTSPFDSATEHLAWLKLWLTAFDFATLLLVVWLLRMTGRHIGHAVAYGWCPLVMKEVAGSGHLDSIATFFAMLAVALVVRSLRVDGETGERPPRGWGWVLGASAAMSLGVGAKLFPVVLAPLLVLVWLRRVSWTAGLGGGALVCVLSALLLAPMLFSTPPEPPAVALTAPEASAADIGAASESHLPPPPDDPLSPDLLTNARTPPPEQDKTAGIAAFLSRWEINDLIYLVLIENLRPQAGVAADKQPWFAFIGDGASAAAVDAFRAFATRFLPAAAGWDHQLASFILARLITAIVFGCLALAFAWRASAPGATGADFACAAFLTLAWFWLLAPTQNPWYWCWAAPLLPFARNRAWAALAACCLLYYTWRWFQAHFPESGVLGTPYNGSYFFFFVVPWVEFGPWLVALASEDVLRRWTGDTPPAGNPAPSDASRQCD